MPSPAGTRLIGTPCFTTGWYLVQYWHHFMTTTRIAVTKESPARSAFTSFTRLLVGILVLAVLAGGCVGSCKRRDAADTDDDAQRSELSGVDLHEQRALVKQHRELAEQEAALTAEQRKAFADAYCWVGVSLYERGKHAESEPYFREALRLQPKHARATMGLGDLCAVRCEFLEAFDAYEHAAKLDAALGDVLRKRLARLAQLAFAEAERQIADSEIVRAREVLEFVRDYLDEFDGSTARKRLAQIEPLFQPEQLVARHQALAGQGKEITPAERELYADAYYSVGARLWRQGKRAESEPYFRAVLGLRPDDARAIVRLGDLFALRRQFRPAAEAYARARTLDTGLTDAIEKRRTRLTKTALAIAAQRAADSKIAAAIEALEFVEEFFGDIGGEEARTQLEQVKPLLRAEQLLAEARDELAHYRNEEGYKRLRQIATKYPRTYFAQEANRLLEKNGQKIVLCDTATGYKLPTHWRRTSTEHFEIYYERATGLSGSKRYAEEAFARIVSDFGMDDAAWTTRVTMYLFSDDESWREFLQMNPDTTMEWAGGFALPWANEIYLYVTERRSHLYKHVLPHELTHVLHHRYVGGIEQPLWLMEGLAVSQEKGGVKGARRAIDDLVENNAAFRLAKLFSLTYYPSEAIHLFYAQSATVVGFMIDEYGLDAFKEFMFAFADTHDTVEVIDSVYGISLDTFEEKWEKYAR